MSDEINRTVVIIGDQGAGKSYCLVRRMGEAPGVRLAWDPNQNLRYGGRILHHIDGPASARWLARARAQAEAGRDDGDIHALDWCEVGSDQPMETARALCAGNKVDRGVPIHLGVDEAITVPGIAAGRTEIVQSWADSLARRRHLRLVIYVCATRALQIHHSLTDQATELVLFRQANEYDLDRLRKSGHVPAAVLAVLPGLRDRYHVTIRPGQPPAGPTDNPLE